MLIELFFVEMYSHSIPTLLHTSKNLLFAGVKLEENYDTAQPVFNKQLPSGSD